MKLSLIEYGHGIEVNSLAPQLDSITLNTYIEKANNVIKVSLGTKRDALVISDGVLRALGIAGTIKLSKDIELEIIPKLLSDDSSNWKESLFLLAALSKYGNIITSEHIHSSTAYKDSLYDIAGRILAREYSSHKRKPIRQYRRERFIDYAVDGEIDFETLFERNPDGIPQTRVSFDKINPYNSTIQAAMRIVLPYVKDNSTRSIIGRAIQELGLQRPQTNENRMRVPSRNKEWKGIYDLSFDIVSGMGSTLESGEILSPSFIVDTWRIWEWLITVGMKIGLGSQYLTKPQATTAWGIKRSQGKTYQVNVFPDVAVYDRSNSNSPVFLVDAKYKVLPDHGNIEVDRLDLYEAFAFCNATGVRRLLLAYPAIVDDDHESGSVSLLSDYEIGDVTISAIKISFGAITKQGDIASFCRRMAANIMAALV